MNNSATLDIKKRNLSRIFLVKILLLCFMLGIANKTFCQYDYLETDSLALVELYNSTNGDNWYNNFGWKTYALQKNYWYGVLSGIVDVDFRVYHLSLGGNRLTGDLPNQLGDLTGLSYLTLAGNPITGILPSTIGELHKLESLEIFSTNISSLPTTIGGLTSLKILDIGWTQIPEIPSEISNLSNLEELYARYAQLDTIEPGIYNCTSLKNLRLGGYYTISAEISEDIGNLINLGNLDLSQNKIEGNIPEQMTNLNQLYWVDFSNNDLRGSIPIGMSSLPNLERLQIYNNYFTFGDILPFYEAGTPPSTFGYSPQKKFGNIYTIDLLMGDDYTIDLIIDSEVPDNKYKWYRDGALIDSTYQNTFAITGAILPDAGVYTCKVTNPRLPLLTLESNPITINVSSCNIETYNYTWTVTNTLDPDPEHCTDSLDITSFSGVNSLRWVIAKINSFPEGTTHKVEFNILGEAPHIITIKDYNNSALIVERTVNIDGSTQPANGYTGIEPHIQLKSEITSEDKNRGLAQG